MSSPPLFHAHDLTVQLGGRRILHEVSFDLPPGTWVGLLGPNGSGKTTLLRTLSGVLPYQGEVRFDGTAVRDWSPRERARRLAFVRQTVDLTFDFTVRDLVLLGATPRTGWLAGYTTEDHRRASQALAEVELAGFEDRSVLALSGGETQRAFLAQALMQDADVLLLDEPTAHLDVHHQYGFMDRVAALAAEGRTILTVFHDLELAARYAERLWVLHDGRLVADGPPGAVLTSELIERVFRMQAHVAMDASPPRITYLAPR